MICHEGFDAFCLFQSRIHEVWARFFGSSREDRFVYTIESLETFPFPTGWQNNRQMEEAGSAYYRFRADLMKKSGLGLTDIYNQFHDPGYQDESMVQLRRFHAEMDRAVLNCYKWSNVKPEYEFKLRFKKDRVPGAGKGEKRLPWIYTWSDSVHDDILGKLLELNQIEGSDRNHRETLECTGPQIVSKNSMEMDLFPPPPE